MLLTDDFDYVLPEALIACRPLAERAGSRMMVMHRGEERVEHRGFQDFSSFLRKGDLVVLNDTRVIPARAFSDDGRIEFLFLEQVAINTWKCMVKPGRKMPVGKQVAVGGVAGEVIEILPDGERVIAFCGVVDL